MNHEPNLSTSQATNTNSLKKSIKTQGVPRFLWIVAGVILITLWANASYISDLWTVYFSQAGTSVVLTDIAEHSGFNIHGTALFYRTNPEVVDADTLNEKCPNTSQDSVEYGCYLPTTNKIYLLGVPNADYKEIEYSTAAHETLHAAWHTLDDATRKQIETELQTLYKTSAATSVSSLHEILAAYQNDPAPDISNELHSFVGSIVPDNDLTTEITSYYSEYFSNRSLAVTSYSNFNTKLDTKSSQIESERQALIRSSDEIDAYKVKWLDSIERAMASNKYYGDYYTYNKNVDAYNHNLVNYNKMVDEYETNRQSFNQMVDQYNSILASFRPSSTKVENQ